VHRVRTDGRFGNQAGHGQRRQRHLMADGLQVHVEGLKQFQSALRRLGPEWNRELGKIHREVAKQVALRARSNAEVLGPQQARSAGAIRWSGTATAAKIRTVQNSRYPFASPAFWGRIKRTGWYARVWAMSPGARPQGLPWVGSDWD